MTTPTHSIRPVSNRYVVISITILRSFFLAVFIYGLNKIAPLGTSLTLIIAGTWLGIIAATGLAFSGMRFSRFILSYLALFALFHLTFIALYAFLSDYTVSAFTVDTIKEHSKLILLFFSLASLSTWLFWRVPGVSTFEVIALILIIIIAFSGHRNFHFESPKFINSLAWSLGTEPLTILVVLGAVASVGTLLLSYLTALVPLANELQPTDPSAIYTGKGNRIFSVFLIVAISLCFWFLCKAIYEHYYQEQVSRTANGVGEEKNPGMSPLGFHSALGGTNQPAALVRLDGDYKENPFSPMLYFRESALSEFNDREMVIAERTYDTDVANTSPTQPYSIEPDQLMSARWPIAFSAYLLADHKLAFAIDYPIAIRQIKNPNPQRFKGAFHAESLAPVYKVDNLNFHTVGDPSWTKATWDHYLKTHSDTRYKDLAEKVTTGAMTSIEKVKMVIGFLSHNAIYTLTPKHEVAATEDPVAPFLFGDMRGYCVHFAHATVYMLRSLGIPARIGTGYLTDLNQSKDGHILLRMSDRHAWAEVYVTNQGWVPYDVKPERVESHADAEVDMKLLEDLMGMIGPDEDILPKDTGKEELEIPDAPVEMPVKPTYLYLVALLFFSGVYILKLYIRFGWMLTRNPVKRIKRIYRALASFYLDLGYPRESGETRREYQRRISNTLNVDALQCTTLLLHQKYGSATLSTDSITTIYSSEKREIENLSRLRRFVASINLSSIWTAVQGGRW